MLLVYLSLSIVVAYLCATYFKSGKDIPESISSTYFVLEYKKLFGITLILASSMLLYPFYLITPLKYMFLPILGVIGMCMVGFFPNTSDPKQLRLHMIGGVGGCTFFNIWTSFIGTWYISLSWAFIIIGSVWLCKTDNEIVRNRILSHIKEHIIFWVEVITLLGVYGALFVKNTQLF